jgi:hypothetical protein
MNEHDPSDPALHSAFSARLDDAPVPSDAMYARVMETIEPAPSMWTYVAPPLRWAAAAIIVIVGGTAIFQTIHAGSHDLPPYATTVVMRDSQPHVLHINLPVVRSANMRIFVNNMPVAFERLTTIAQREKASPTEKTVTSHSIETTILVDPERLAATMHSVAALGTVHSSSTRSDNVGADIRKTTAALLTLRQQESSLRANGAGPSSASLVDVQGRAALLSAHLQVLSRNIATATLHVTFTAQS